MKCPKCNFVSFDYNDACPKCGKNLTHERDLMDLPSYKPRVLSPVDPLNAYTETPGDTTRDGQPPLAKEAMDDVTDELLISLDDLSNDEPVPIQVESDPTQAEPGQKIDDEITFDLSPPNSEEANSKKDDAAEKAPDLFAKQEAPGETKGQEPIVELELEPLEFDLDLEEPDEKKS